MWIVDIKVEQKTHLITAHAHATRQTRQHGTVYDSVSGLVGLGSSGSSAVARLLRSDARHQHLMALSLQAWSLFCTVH